MNGFKKTIRNFFGTTRAQTNGFVGLLIVITLVIFSQPVTRWWVSSRPADFSKDAAVLDSLTRVWETSIERRNVEPPQDAPVSYFNFDPNTATQEELKSLGFSEKLAVRVVRYRANGGSFRIKSDLLKLYGMDSVLYGKVARYIDLPDRFERPKFEKRTFATFSKPAGKREKFNLNEADTTQLKKIYGIGSKLAWRIVTHRDKLGGFVLPEQVQEIYGLDTAVIKRILSASYLPDPPGVRTINLNTADETVLAAHPYFGRKIARAVVAYRFQHGNFKSVDDLGKISLIDKNKLVKIIPYVTVDP